jgi:hypothetical protein
MLMATGNGLLRRAFRPTIEVSGGWRKLHIEEFHHLYYSQNVVRIFK